jgi:hypothetical protein
MRVDNNCLFSVVRTCRILTWDFLYAVIDNELIFECYSFFKVLATTFCSIRKEINYVAGTRFVLMILLCKSWYNECERQNRVFVFCGWKPEVLLLFSGQGKVNTKCKSSGTPPALPSYLHRIPFLCKRRYGSENSKEKMGRSEEGKVL